MVGHDLLNENQRVTLTNVLRMFDESLHRAETWLDGAEEGSILYHRRLYLSEGRQQEARQKIHFALDEITALAKTFEMTPRQENASSLVYSDMIHLRADLTDTTSKKLNRYGEVDARLSEVLDPAIERLLVLASEIAQAFNE
jgi:hypothetical protein